METVCGMCVYVHIFYRIFCGHVGASRPTLSVKDQGSILAEFCIALQNYGEISGQTLTRFASSC